jgi:hypothetical protein
MDYLQKFNAGSNAAGNSIVVPLKKGFIYCMDQLLTLRDYQPAHTINTSQQKNKACALLPSGRKRTPLCQKKETLRTQAHSAFAVYI